jgi:hypothetical protein
MGPTVFGLLMREPIGFGDRGSLGQAVRRDLLGLGPRGRSHTLMDRLAVDAGVDQKMHDVDVVRPEFARHGLSYRAQSEFGRRKCRKSLTAPNAGGSSGKEDRAVSAWNHDASGFAANLRNPAKHASSQASKNNFSVVSSSGLLMFDPALNRQTSIGPMLFSTSANNF